MIGEIRMAEDINCPKINGIELGRLYQKFSGRRLLVSPAAAIAEFSLIHEANPQHPITYKQASELVMTSARIENFAFVRDGKNPDLDILTASAGIRISDQGIPVYGDSDILPDGDGIISYVMTLKYVAPAIVLKHFTRTAADFARNSYSSIAAVPNAPVLVITDHTDNIRRFIAIQAKIDRPVSNAAE